MVSAVFLGSEKWRVKREREGGRTRVDWRERVGGLLDISNYQRYRERSLFVKVFRQRI